MWKPALITFSFRSLENCCILNRVRILTTSMLCGLEFFYFCVILRVSQFNLKITWALFNIKEEMTAHRMNLVLYFLATLKWYTELLI
jgi:hypothetical protein